MSEPLPDVPLPDVPLLDLREQGIAYLDEARRARLLRLRDACLGFLPFGKLLSHLTDRPVRNWLKASGSPYVDDIARLEAQAKVSGVWTLHGAYVFGCTAMADESTAGPRLRRTLDWPFHGLGRLVEVVRQRGAAGEFHSVTWPGFVGTLTGMAPGRFGIAINQAPLRWRTGSTAFRFVDYARNALAVLPKKGLIPPEHLLRQAFETCATFAEAVDLLRRTPVARPVLFIVAGIKPQERVIIEREEHTARTLTADETVANAWRGMPDGWRPRVCGAGTPEENNLRRMAALDAHRNSDADWALSPVTNTTTRLTVDLCPASGRLAVQGWEAGESGGARPVTNILSVG